MRRRRGAITVNATQISFITRYSEGTRIRFGEGRNVTVVEPMDEIIERLNHLRALPVGQGDACL